MNTYFSMNTLKSVGEHLPEKLIASAGVTTRFTQARTQGLRKDFVRTQKIKNLSYIGDSSDESSLILTGTI